MRDLPRLPPLHRLAIRAADTAARITYWSDLPGNQPGTRVDDPVYRGDFFVGPEGVRESREPATIVSAFTKATPNDLSADAKERVEELGLLHSALLAEVLTELMAEDALEVLHVVASQVLWLAITDPSGHELLLNVEVKAFSLNDLAKTLYLYRNTDPIPTYDLYREEPADKTLDKVGSVTLDMPLVLNITICNQSPGVLNDEVQQYTMNFAHSGWYCADDYKQYLVKFPVFSLRQMNPYHFGPDSELARQGGQCFREAARAQKRVRRDEGDGGNKSTVGTS